MGRSSYIATQELSFPLNFPKAKLYFYLGA